MCERVCVPGLVPFEDCDHPLADATSSNRVYVYVYVYVYVNVNVNRGLYAPVYMCI